MFSSENAINIMEEIPEVPRDVHVLTLSTVCICCFAFSFPRRWDRAGVICPRLAVWSE